MMPQPKIERTLGMREPQMRLIEIHDHDCDCSSCAPDRLTATDMGKLACLGAAVGSAIMFAIDPAGAAAALLATIGVTS
ncbi:hypothetical protein E5673_08150 [Sphingomonas sp. PAMC26645]|uniref:hypothetical protein n=1 Tax=Sphingomonas sp. PAMC26645 TaxID=2565555 RepID=UPI00109DCD75|nr:hypothetical protein [Sphingomonas sp. PAMC26645]QCB42206.1 hypothetical protein E5673_08150 [Sphingomonas sp. PAMC26645]